METTAATTAADPSETLSAFALVEARKQARRRFEDAIELLPLNEKGAYLQAKKHSPELFETETDPLWFIRSCDYNMWEASRRMCGYWEERLKVFGAARAFLPLVLTGDGALTKDDILTIRAGYPAILPNTRNGLQVVFADRRRFFPGATHENKLRCLFYVFNHLAQDERAQCEGVLCIILMILPRLLEMDRPYVRRAIRLARHLVPVKLKFHLLNMPPTNSNRRYNIQDAFIFASTLFSTENLEVHFEREHGDLLVALRDLGMEDAGIPSFLGGTWTFVECDEWCKARAEEDHGKHDKWALLRKRRRLTLNNETLPLEDQGQSLESWMNTLVSPVGPNAQAEQGRDLDSERKEKRRQQNILWSRQGRDRRRKEIGDLKHEHNRLVQENKRLCTEHAELETLLEQAQQITATLEADHV